jgi:hypothetical protein
MAGRLLPPDAARPEILTQKQKKRKKTKEQKDHKKEVFFMTSLSYVRVAEGQEPCCSATDGLEKIECPVAGLLNWGRQ